METSIHFPPITFATRSMPQPAARAGNHRADRCPQTAAFTLIERARNFRFSIPDFRFPDDHQASASISATQRRDSAQSKIGNPKSKISRASRASRVSRARRGFTLIELLAVIAIIGVLAALVLATLGTVRSTARRVRCVSNLRQITLAALQYSHDRKDNRTVPANFYGALVNSAWLPKLTKGDMLALNGVWMCPEDAKDRTGVGDSVGIDQISYGYNAGRIGFANGGYWSVSKITLSEISNPSRTLYFCDARLYYMDKASANQNAEFRHRGKINAAFFDGHVSTLPQPSPVSRFYNDLF